MIDITPILPLNDNAVAVAVSSDTYPVKIFYGMDPLNGEVEWNPHDTLNAPASVEILNLDPGTWYCVLAVDASGTPGRMVRQLPRLGNPYFKIDLYRQSVDTVVRGRTNCFRLRVEAKNPVNLVDDGIFLYWNDGADDPLFQAVCKPSDLETYQLNGQAVGFIRKNFVDVLENNQDLLEDDWSAIFEDVRILLENLDRNRLLARDMFVQVTGEYNQQCLQPVPGSSGSSGSSSLAP